MIFIIPKYRHLKTPAKNLASLPPSEGCIPQWDKTYKVLRIHKLITRYNLQVLESKTGQNKSQHYCRQTFCMCKKLKLSSKSKPEFKCLAQKHRKTAEDGRILISFTPQTCQKSRKVAVSCSIHSHHKSQFPHIWYTSHNLLLVLFREINTYY